MRSAIFCATVGWGGKPIGRVRVKLRHAMIENIFIAYDFIFRKQKQSVSLTFSVHLQWFFLNKLLNLRVWFFSPSGVPLSWGTDWPISVQIIVIWQHSVDHIETFFFHRGVKAVWNIFKWNENLIFFDEISKFFRPGVVGLSDEILFVLHSDRGTFWPIYPSCQVLDLRN